MGTALTGQKIKDTYKDLLHLDNSNAGVDATLNTLVDGDGNDCPVQLSTAQVNIAPTPGNDATKPSLSFGDGDSGIYEKDDDNLRFAIGGSIAWEMGASYFRAATDGGARVSNIGTSATVPGFLPNENDTNTGIGAAAADQCSIIAGGTEVARASEAGAATSTQFIVSPGATLGAAATPSLAFGDGDTGFYENSDDSVYFAVGGNHRLVLDNNGLRTQVANAPQLYNVSPTATAPNHTFRDDLDTGIGRAAADQLSLIAGGVEVLRCVEDATYEEHTILDGYTKRYSGQLALTDNDVIDVMTVTIAANDGFACTLDYTIYITDGTDMQTHTGVLLISANNKAGTISDDIVHPAGVEAEDLTAGTLTEAWTANDNGDGTLAIRVQANTSLTPTTFTIQLNVNVLKSSTGLVFT